MIDIKTITVLTTYHHVYILKSFKQFVLSSKNKTRNNNENKKKQNKTKQEQCYIISNCPSKLSFITSRYHASLQIMVFAVVILSITCIIILYKIMI